ncbi:MAG: RluA family pseudouridine synthase [Eubacteriales bacterium]|nr:RluA family pseudouridine synthase [Eubacteriales bacterium]
MRTKNSLNILFEDDDIIVCVKPHGLATQTKKTGTPDLEHMLLNHIARADTGSRPYIAVIHRLDQPVSGILVFAKNKSAAAALSRQIISSGFGKHYLALVDGCPKESSGDLTDYLVKDGRTNTSRVCSPDTPGARIAKLHYEVLEKTSDKQTRLKITLDTGRHHQIRVQLSHLGCPIAGDTKYNPAASNIRGYQELKLCAYRLTFRHPRTGESMHFEIGEL